MQADLPNVRPRKEIDLAPFGKEGKIVIEKMDFYRTLALQNSSMSIILSPEDKEKLKSIENPVQRDKFINDIINDNMATMQAIAVLASITEAPFHINDYKRKQQLDFKSFAEFLDMDLYNALRKAVDELEKDSPLPPQTPTVQSN